MNEAQINSKQALLDEMEQAWDELEAALRRLSPAQLTVPTDAEGWTGKDHVVHMAAWGQSVIYLLQHKPRHEGLGIDEQLYLAGAYDAMNAVIQRQNSALPLDQALAWLSSTHAKLLTLVQEMSDEDLAKPYRFYLPDEPGEGDGPPAHKVIYANSAGHYREHQAWLASLVNAT